MDVLFVGINPGHVSARAGHHFANPSNAFWRLLHDAGFTPSLFSPQQDRRLPELGLGITNLVARESAGVSDLSREELTAGAVTLGRAIERWRPGAVVFVGLTAWTAFARRFGLLTKGGRPRCGERRERFAGARLFVLPNPSGRNAHYTYAQMRALYRRAARALGRGPAAARDPRPVIR